MYTCFESLLAAMEKPNGSMELMHPATKTMRQEVDRSDSVSKTMHRGEIVSIQYLRGLAALGVLLCHASLALLDKEQGLVPLGAGAAGVDLFFVISGFIMFYTTANRPLTTGEFYLRRFIRIFPLYFAVSTLAFLIARVAPFATRTFSPNLIDYIRSILFVPYYTTTGQAATLLIPLVRPEVGQGWTLDYEVFFYAIFGLSLYVPQRYRMRAFMAVFLVLATIGVLFRPSGAIFSTYTDSLLLEFVLGVVLGHVLIRKCRNSIKIAGVLLLTSSGIASVAIQVFTTSSLPRVIAFGLPAASIVAIALWLEHAELMPRLPFLLLLGDASYSLYLLHGFVLAVLRRVWQRYFDVNLISTHIIFILVSVLAAEVVGIVAFRYAERPVTRTLTTAFKKAGLIRDKQKARESQSRPHVSETVHAI
jgi:exopolysaccharide production protein ExoZ